MLHFLEHKILWYALRCSWLASAQWWHSYLCISQKIQVQQSNNMWLQDKDKVINTINTFPTQHVLQNFHLWSAINKLIKAKQSTIDMSCENKLTNLVFKNKEKSARTTMCSLFLSFLPFFFYFLYIYRIKTPRMKCIECNAMQHLETEEKNTKTKDQRTMVTKEKQWSTRTMSERLS